MLVLEDNTPHLFQLFNSGLFVVRRSDRFWAGLPSDFVIEQVLMRTVKTTGGLTRGRGLEENQRTRWLLSTPACAQVNEAIQELTGAQYNTSDQHKDLTKARKERDHMDRLNILEYFQDYNPFAPSELHCHGCLQPTLGRRSRSGDPDKNGRPQCVRVYFPEERPDKQNGTEVY